ncbi:hypothetical protein [Hominenteromicrobium sp.]|uniref:hypothetical protein n=1 Tax=Hominenteromicrobium sp. TaxID=3073581 RepID=UPI003AF06CD9
MDAEKENPKSGTKTVLVVLAVLVALIFGFLFITGKFPTHTEQTPGAAESYAVVQENKQALEDCITKKLDAETAKTVSEITVSESNGEYSVSIRVILAGGFYFPEVIEQTAQPFFDKAEELGLAVDVYEVMEYSKGNTGDIEDFICWRSHDGTTGTYSDDRGKEPIVKANTTADDIRDIVK